MILPQVNIILFYNRLSTHVSGRFWFVKRNIFVSLRPHRPELFSSKAAVESHEGHKGSGVPQTSIRALKRPFCALWRALVFSGLACLVVGRVWKETPPDGRRGGRGVTPHKIRGIKTKKMVFLSGEYLQKDAFWASWSRKSRGKHFCGVAKRRILLV